MKKHIVLIAVLSLFAAPLHANDEHHPEKQQAVAVQSKERPADIEWQREQARDIVTKMQKQMNEIRHAKNPQERRKLMREHMQTMQEGMNMMRSMGSGMMMGGSMMGGGMQGSGNMMGSMGGSNMDANANNMMEMRMEMMTEMMEQMMQQEQMSQRMRSK